MNYPQILTSLSGNKITTKDEWEKHRRDEIYYLFQNFVYGVPPIDKPENMKFSVKEIEREQNILQKKVTISFDFMEFEADVFVPAKNQKPLPAFFLTIHQGYEEKYNFDKELDFEIIHITDVISRGYAVVIMKTSGICPDLFQNKLNSEKLYCDGIFTKLNYVHRSNSWSIIAAWSWGVSRVMDYLETDKDIDSNKVIITGHSRCGKTALWSAASDKRFAMCVSNNSGCTGAAFTRGKTGEHLDYINPVTHWFCENYTKYTNDEDMLPVDQHMLLALIAPRPLYVASSSEDDWADPNAELVSCRLAGEAYGLYGLEGVIVPEEGAEVDTEYHEGTIAYHKKTGSHSLTKYDWDCFMNFADKYIK